MLDGLNAVGSLVGRPDIVGELVAIEYVFNSYTNVGFKYDDGSHLVMGEFGYVSQDEIFQPVNGHLN